MIAYAEKQTESVCRGELTAMLCRQARGGCGRHFVYASSDRVTVDHGEDQWGHNDRERFVVCPCGKKHLLAAGALR